MSDSPTAPTDPGTAPAGGAPAGHARRRRLRPRHVVPAAIVVAAALGAGQLMTGSSGAQADPGAEVAADVVRVAEFVAECTFSHRLPDDPIVFPNLPGASHMHSFFGNDAVDAHTTVEDLLQGESNCDPHVDLSGYWVPTLFVDGEPVEPATATFYYLGEGVNDDVVADIRPMPPGLKMLAGNAVATSPDEASSRWSCLHAGHVEPSKDFVECPPDTMMESYLDFPQCWDGVNLDSADHKSHMSYPVAGRCPESHPVPVPKLRQVLRYPVNGDPSRFELASGPGYTMHGDLFNAWPEDEMERRVRDCINPVIKCGPDGRP
ncbi:DUF1996 domain-containing protein [Streptomyces sp. ST2-7A]|uniref:DUF1996 domain-containing protein n=1 Tax=Streptomyces sp. ST2-7A TaxID=2907214 RepID=UPI0035ABAEBB